MTKQLLNRDEIVYFLNGYGVENYTIHADMSVDVEGNVMLNDTQLIRIPVKFGRVSGTFDCSYNELESLHNAPEWVGKNFSCAYNQLTSLEFGPQHVGRGMSCTHNSLVSLLGSPEILTGSFYCQNNCLTSLLGAPKNVGHNFVCYDNHLTCYKDRPLQIGKNFDYSDNPVSYEAYLIQEKIKKDIEDEKTALRQKVMCEKKVKAVSKFKI